MVSHSGWEEQDRQPPFIKFEELPPPMEKILVKTVKFSVLAFSSFFCKFCSQNLWHFEDVSVKCPKQFLYYIEFICRRVCEKKLKSEFHVFDWFHDLQILEVFLEIYCGASLETIFRQKYFPKNPCFFIITSLLYGLEK